MTDAHFDYDELVQGALRGAIRQVLQHVADHGLPGEHHFYITFETHADGVNIPAHLKERYADDMTIVLQHRYWGLKVEEEYFELKLSFDGKPELLVIPFAALIAFVDPSAQFALQFTSDLYPPDELAAGEEAAGKAAESSGSGEAAILAPKPKKKSRKGAGAKAGGGKVVALDTFRKNS